MKKLSQWPWKNISIGLLILVLLALIFKPDMNLSSISMPSSKNFATIDGEMAEMQAMRSSYAITTDEAAGGLNMIAPPTPAPGGIATEVETRHLIRRGKLSLIVADVTQSLKDITKDVQEQWKGLVEESSLDNMDDDRQSGWMRLRVPSDQFDAAMEGLKNSALKVESERTSVDDVTGQVVDQEARLKNLRIEEEQYQSILSRATEIEDVLQATDYLNRVRNEIEWAERSLKDINEQVAMSTINLNLIDEGDVEVLGVYWTPWLNVKKAARGALENLTESVDTLVMIVLNLPLILIWIALISLGGWLGWKGLKKTGIL